MELDAIPPRTLRQMVRRAIDPHLDAGRLKSLKLVEAEERRILTLFGREAAARREEYANAYASLDEAMEAQPLVPGQAVWITGRASPWWVTVRREPAEEEGLVYAKVFIGKDDEGILPDLDDDAYATLDEIEDALAAQGVPVGRMVWRPGQ